MNDLSLIQSVNFDALPYRERIQAMLDKMPDEQVDNLTVLEVLSIARAEHIIINGDDATAIPVINAIIKSRMGAKYAQKIESNVNVNGTITVKAIRELNPNVLKERLGDMDGNYDALYAAYRGRLWEQGITSKEVMMQFIDGQWQRKEIA